MLGFYGNRCPTLSKRSKYRDRNVLSFLMACPTSHPIPSYTLQFQKDFNMRRGLEEKDWAGCDGYHFQ